MSHGAHRGILPSIHEDRQRACWHPLFLHSDHPVEGITPCPFPPPALLRSFPRPWVEMGSRLSLAQLVSHLLTYTRLCSAHFRNKLHLAMAQGAALRRIMPLNAAFPKNPTRMPGFLRQLFRPSRGKILVRPLTFNFKKARFFTFFHLFTPIYT